MVFLNNTNLLREAEYFCHKIFGCAIPQEVAERYAKAWLHCFPSTDLEFQAKLDSLVRDRRDIEAIEIVLRYRNPDNLLSKKIKILFYLLEVRAEFLPRFVNFENRTFLAYRQLFGALFYTAWKVFKGHVLGRRYGLL